VQQQLAQLSARVDAHDRAVAARLDSLDRAVAATRGEASASAASAASANIAATAAATASAATAAGLSAKVDANAQQTHHTLAAAAAFQSQMMARADALAARIQTALRNGDLMHTLALVAVSHAPQLRAAITATAVAEALHDGSLLEALAPVVRAAGLQQPLCSVLVARLMERLPKQDPSRTVLQQLHSRAPIVGREALVCLAAVNPYRFACVVDTYGRRGRDAVEAEAAMWLQEERVARALAAQAAAQPKGFWQWVKDLAAP
jgi:hypothetical protein